MGRAVIPPELLQIAILGLLGLLSIAVTIIGFFVARTLSKIDDNQKLLFERQTKHGEKLAELWGEHRAHTAKKG